MLFRSLFLAAIGCLSFVSAVFAQGITDSVFVMPEVTISSDRVAHFAVGTTVEHVDSTTIKSYRAQSLSELLAGETGLTVNTYGVAGLATPRTRGGGSDHTPVVWNGFNLQAHTNGSVNLSTMSACMLDKVSVQYGGAATQYGSGAVSGVVHLSGADFISQKNYAEIHWGGGSFGRLSGGLRAKVGGEKLAFSIRAFAQEAQNNFPYYNTERSYKNPPREIQTHAGYKQQGFMPELMAKTGEHSRLKVSLWLQHFDKDLQTEMFDAGMASQTQEDNSVRMAANWQLRKDDFSLTAKLGALYDEVLYNNPEQAKPQSNSFSLSRIAELEASYSVAQGHLLQGGLNGTYETAASNGYVGKESRSRLSPFLLYKAERVLGLFTATTGLRSECINGSFTPAVASLGLVVHLPLGVELMGNAGRSYRVPTFNDLYWKSDTWATGNPNLVPERGWNADMGIKADEQLGNLRLMGSCTYYQTELENWIVWLPSPEAEGKWMPTNKKMGTSHGVDLLFQGQYKLGKYQLHLNSTYSYSQSHFRTKAGMAKEEMWYVPHHKASVGMQLRHKQFFAGPRAQYYGSRAYGGFGRMDPYALLGVSAGYGCALGQRMMLDINLKINNILSRNYQVMPSYAMPLANFMAGASLRFQ